VIILDDAQWADAESLRLLEFVARELRTDPLLALATVRQPQPGADPLRESLLASLASCGRSIRLTGLDAAGVGELLADRLGHAPTDAVAARLHRTSGGNPFFVIEFAQLLARDAGAGTRGQGEIPRAVQQILRERLTGLSEPSLRALEVASVIGEEFELVLLGPASGVAQESLLVALDEPLARGLLRETPGGLRRYAFAHALLREAVQARLAASRRAELHAAVAAALESAGAADDERLPALAHHLFESVPGHSDPLRAVQHGCAAGERALGVFAYDEALRWFERALSLLPANADGRTRLRILSGLGQSAHELGDVARSARCFDDALALARSLGPSEFAATALRSAEARVEVEGLNVEQNALVEEALERLPAERTALRARLLARAALGGGTLACRVARIEEALAIARTLGDPATLGYVLVRALFCTGPDDLARRLAMCEEAAVAGSAGLAAEREVLGLRAIALAEAGDRAGLDAALAAFEQRVLATRNPRPHGNFATMRAGIALLEGRLAESEQLSREALAQSSRLWPQTAASRFAQQLFILRAWQGRLPEVAPLLDRAAQALPVPAWRAALALFNELCGRSAEARREFEALAADDFAGVPRDLAWLAAMGVLAWLCVRLGDVRRAEVLYRLLSPYADRVVVSGLLAVVLCPVALRLGMLAAVAGRHEEAEVHFSHALAIADRMRALPWQAEVRFHWAELLRARGARGDRERATRMLDEAEAIAEPIGMKLLVDWIAQSRAAAWKAASAVAAGGGRASDAAAERGTVLSLVPRLAAAASAPPARPAVRSGAFRREGEVWTVALDGRTTRVPDLRGLAHLARLLAEPGRELHARDLAGAPGAESDAVGRGDAGELLDARARADYERRLREARAELDDAERSNDLGRAESAREELEFLTAELARGFGLGGRARRAGDANERARISVTRAIKYAIERIAESDPSLADHLRRAVRTGVFCAYEPSERDRVAWTLDR
jgi:tetratricopeptide (TPR) repeat protein